MNAFDIYQTLLNAKIDPEVTASCANAQNRVNQAILEQRFAELPTLGEQAFSALQRLQSAEAELEQRLETLATDLTIFDNEIKKFWEAEDCAQWTEFLPYLASLKPKKRGRPAES
jgi:hypothetical protein